MNNYKPIFNHAAIKAAKKQEKKEKTIIICGVATATLLTIIKAHMNMGIF